MKKGFSLVEVVLSLGIATFCLLTLVALLPGGIQTEKASSDETRAINILAAVVSDIRYSPLGGPSSYFGIVDFPVEAGDTKFSKEYMLTEGETLTTQNSEARFILTLTQYPNDSIDDLNPIGILVEVSWPAQAASTDRSRVETYATFFQ